MKKRKRILKSESVTYLSGDVIEFIPLSGVEAKNKAYHLCGCKHTDLHMEEVIAVGFGNALLTKNGECIYSEMEAQSCNDYLTVAQAEELAASDPYNDWRVHLISPFSELHYQRQGKCHWVLYEKGEGFA